MTLSWCTLFGLKTVTIKFGYSKAKEGAWYEPTGCMSGPQRPHKHKDPTKHGFLNFPGLGSQN